MSLSPPLEDLKEWILESLERHNIARVSWNILRKFLEDSLEKNISPKHSFTYQEALILSGKPEKAKTKTDYFEEWLKENQIEYWDSHDQTRIFKRRIK